MSGLELVAIAAAVVGAAVLLLFFLSPVGVGIRDVGRALE
jgi:hypothetical protein